MRLFRTKSLSWFSRWTITPTFMFEDPIAVRHSLLRILAVADRRSLDVVRTIDLFSQEHWGLNRARLQTFLRDITAPGKSLDNMKYSPLMSDHSLLAIRLGKATDTLSSVWKELAIWERPANTESCKLWSSNKAYWTVVAIAMAVVSTYIALNVGRLLPRLAAEFELEPSPFLLQLNQFILVAVLLFLSVAACWTVWQFTAWLFQPWIRRMASWSWREQVTMQINLWRLIAMNLEAGVPASVSIEHLARLHYSSRIRRKLTLANQSIANGQDVWQSLAQAKLMRAEIRHAVAATNATDVQAWTLRHLALQRRENMHFESLRNHMWIQPMITLLFGAFVLAIAYTVFSTLTNMVLSIAERHG